MDLPVPAQELPDADSAEGSADPYAGFDENFDDGVDVTLIRWMLSLSPEQRLDVLQSFLDGIAANPRYANTTETIPATWKFTKQRVELLFDEA